VKPIREEAPQAAQTSCKFLQLAKRCDDAIKRYVNADFRQASRAQPHLFFPLFFRRLRLGLSKTHASDANISFFDKLEAAFPPFFPDRER
jgi:hypothetical protein